MATIYVDGDRRSLNVEIPEENTEAHAGVISVLRDSLDSLGWDVIAVRGGPLSLQGAPRLTITPTSTDTLNDLEAIARIVRRALQLRGVVVE